MGSKWCRVKEEDPGSSSNPSSGPSSAQECHSAITPVVPEVPADSAITPVVLEVPADSATTPVVPAVPADSATTPVVPAVPADSAITPVVLEVPADSAITPVVPAVPADSAITPVVLEVPADLAITAVVPADLATASAAARNITVEGATNCPVIVGDVQTPTFNYVVHMHQTIQPNVSTPDTSICGSKDPSTKTSGCSSPAHEAANRCAHELKSLYSVEGSYMQVNPFVDDDRKHWVNLFTKLELVQDTCKNPKGNKDATVKPISVEEIFTAKTKNGKVVNRAILNGLAGMGKTTLVGKMVYDWASGTTVKQFKLVFLLRMSELNQGSNVLDAIYNQLLATDTKINRDDLESFIQDNQDEVLILLDGFDELQTTSFSEDEFGSILKILNRNTFKYCWVVITTRSSRFDQLVTKPLIQEPYTHVRVLGFNTKDISEYVHRFYSEEQDQDKIDGLLKRITESYILPDLATSPMLLLLFCLLWREYSTLPETLCGIYNEAVEYMLGRKTRKEFNQNAISKIVIELGKVALRGLLSPEQSLSFKETEFDKDTLDKAIKAGVLTRQRVLKKGIYHQDQLQFFHKTMQEFCAGEFFKDLFLTDKTEYKKTLDSCLHSLKEDSRSLEYLLQFSCGNSEHCTNDILKIYHKVWFSDPEWVEMSVLSCYFESQTKRLPPDEVIDMIIEPCISFAYNRYNVIVSFNYFVKQLADKPTGKTKKYLSKVKDGNFTRIIGPRDMNPLCDAFSCMNNLVELDLGGNDKLGGTAASWAHHLKQVKQLKELSLMQCGLIGEDMNPLCDAFSCMNNLVELDLGGNGKLGGTAASWAHHLKLVKQLEKLDMRLCGLKANDKKHLKMGRFQLLS